MAVWNFPAQIVSAAISGPSILLPIQKGHVLTEADTCTRMITPQLRAAGWDDDPHSFSEQHTFTDGRIVLVGNRYKRKKKKRADYFLRYTRDFVLAVVEAKPEDEPAGTGLQQAKDYGLLWLL